MAASLTVLFFLLSFVLCKSYLSDTEKNALYDFYNNVDHNPLVTGIIPQDICNLDLIEFEISNTDIYGDLPLCNTYFI